MSEGINVNIDWKAVNKKEQEVFRALGLVAEVLQDDIREEMIVPRKTGALQGEKFYIDRSEIRKGIVSLAHTGPYARRLYYHPEYNFNREFNVNAQALWFRPWMKGGEYESRPQQILMAILKRGL